MKQILSVLAASLFALPVLSQGFDPAKSYIEFSVSNMWINTVTGTIKGWEGSVEFDPENPRQSTFDVKADLTTINTENEERDEHLRSADFFEVEKYPQIRFESIRVNALADGKLVAIGNLTIKDVEKEVVLPFKLEGNQLIGELTINRFDFNVGVDEGTFGVGKEVSVKIVCELN